jgi:hypothetical protein
MALPKLVTPEHETTIPSTKEPVKFRPFLVKEEKILYMALESGEAVDIKNAILQIMDSCIITPGVDVNKFTTYDVEYIFVKLRSKSVGEIVDINLKHINSECKHQTPYKLNLDTVKIKFDENHSNLIQVTDKIGIKMKSPSLNDVLSLSNSSDMVDNVFKLLLKSVECIFDEDTVYDDFTEKEIEEFMESLTQEQFIKVQNFYNTMPKLSHEITWKCKECSESETIKLEGLQSFFI